MEEADRMLNMGMKKDEEEETTIDYCNFNIKSVWRHYMNEGI